MFNKFQVITVFTGVLFLLTSCTAPKYFNGTVAYTYTYESAVLNKDSLAGVKPRESEFRYDNDHYQSRFFAQDTTTYYYSGRLGKCISQINSINKFECEDYGIPTDSILSYKEVETDEKIFGHHCRIIEWQGKYFYNIFYVSTDIKIAPGTYKNHWAYNWKFYGEKANGGLILKSEHRFKNYTMKGVVVRIKKAKNKFTALTTDMANFEAGCR